MIQICTNINTTFVWFHLCKINLLVMIAAENKNLQSCFFLVWKIYSSSGASADFSCNIKYIPKIWFGVYILGKFWVALSNKNASINYHVAQNNMQKGRWYWNTVASQPVSVLSSKLCAGLPWIRDFPECNRGFDSSSIHGRHKNEK